MLALRSGWNEARRVWDDPARATREQGFEIQHGRYNRLWSYYNNSMFDAFQHPWVRKYLADYRLFPRTRYLYNPVERLVEFYQSQVYPGVLSEDGKALPDGIQIAIPFSTDTPPALKLAIAQFWQWSGWSANMYRMVEEAACLGNTLIELIDDVERGKVTVDFIWPGFLYDLTLDAAGNVKSYIVEYQARDEQGYYRYRKEVNQQAFRYYRDDQLYDFTGHGAVVENLYGFIPARWVRHKAGPGYLGASVIGGMIPVIDELNSKVSQIHDHIGKVIEAPGIIWSDSPIDLTPEDANRDRTDDDQSLLLLQGSTGGSFSPLVGNLDLASADLSIARLYSEIERRHPELTFYEQLRNMSQVTGPAAQRMSGDVESRVLRAQANYDDASMSLFRMATAIGGMRANSGAWGLLNRQQQKFLPFNLDSYQNGDLEMAIMPRSLVAPTKTEVAQEKQAQWAGVSAAVGAGIPLSMALADEGWTKKQLAELEATKAAQTPPQLAAPQAPPIAQAQQMMPIAGQ